MSDLRETSEIFVMLRDGEAECGVALELGPHGPRRVIAAVDASDHVRVACAVIDGLVKNGVPFDAVAALAPDSPRFGEVVTQIAERLAARTAEAKPQGEA